MDPWDALVNLLIGGSFAIYAVYVFVKYRIILGAILWLSFGVAVTASVLLIAVAKSFVRLLNDFSRVWIGNMICPGHGSVTEHAQPRKCLTG